MTELMTVEQFEALCDYLDSPEGCNFHERIPGDSKSVTWKCDYTLTMTYQWLLDHFPRNYPPEDQEDAYNAAVEARVEAVKENVREIDRRGGHCDCEVLFNVAGRWPGQSE